MQLNIKKINPNAMVPTRATAGSAGYDLYACIENEVGIKPSEIVKIPTGISIGLQDKNLVALIYARSGLAIKSGINLPNSVGVIDSDYRGELIVGLMNNTDKTYIIKPFDRIAQMLISPVVLPELVLVDELDETTRADGGFGSTGLK